MSTTPPNTDQKAFQINLDPSKYGTFAEIGAGQEVARWFFHVGGAAGTVAKTISAYDMAVSDAVYGPCDRYVSRKRLQAMLEHEWQLLQERLNEKRGATTTFFVFADTMATRSFSHHEEGHGWMGIRFQHQPQAQSSEIIIHVHILDHETVREQEAIGVMGVNIIYGALYHHPEPAKLIGSLMDNLNRERVEIDMIRFSGPAFSKVDNRLMSLQLVEQGFTEASMFRENGEVVQPSEILYKKPVLIERGGFRPITNLTLDIIERATARFREELMADAGQCDSKEPFVLMEMSLRDLLGGRRIDHADFLARVDLLGALGKSVLISSHGRHFRLVPYLRRYTKSRIAFAMGVPNLKEICEDKYYTDLGGGILEGAGRLFQTGVKLYVYPSKDSKTGKLITAETLSVAPGLRHLQAYLLENQLIESIRNVDENQLDIFPRDVLARIQSGDPAWETMVPPRAVEIIKARKFFGYKSSAKFP